MSFMIAAFWARLCVLMDNSLFFRGIDKLMALTQRMFAGSVLVRFVCCKTDQSMMQSSLAYRIVSGFFGVFKTNGGTCRVAYEKSMTGRLCEKCMRMLEACLSGSFFYQQLFRRSIIGCRADEAVFNMPFLILLAAIGLAPFIPTMMLAALCLLAFAFFFIKLTLDTSFRAHVDMTGICIVLYAAVGFFAALASFARPSSVRIALLTALFMLVYFLFVALVDTKRKMNAVVFAVCVSALLTGLYGTYQRLSGMEDMTWVDPEFFEGMRLRVFSTLGNPNVYGEYLLLIIPIAVAGCFAARRWFMKLFYLGTAALLLANLGWTYSRGCYLGMALAAFIGVLFVQKRLVTFFSAGVFALPFLLPASVIERLLSITNFADSSTSYRISIYQATLRIIKQFWLSGVGQGIDAFNAVYPLYAFNAVPAPHSHSLYLQVMVEKGIFGFVVFLTVLVYFFKTLIPLLKQTERMDEKIFAAALMATAGGFLLQGVFDYVFYNYKVLFMFFILLAMGGAYANICQKGGDRA